MGILGATRRDFLKVVGAGAGVLAGSEAVGRAAQAGSSATKQADAVREQPRDVPVVHHCDICVVGGGSAGVFAAVRAARLGASVALIENNGFFGGVATAAKVNIWHSICDTAGEKQIIGGLTVEVLERLKKRDAVVLYKANESRYAVFNTFEMIIELDELVREHRGIRSFLHARFVAAVAQDGTMTHAIIEDKSGRRAIAAKYFIDATGDGDLIARMGLPFTKNDDLQPPTMCVFIHGLDEVEKQNPGFELGRAIYDPRYPNALKRSFFWSSQAVGSPGTRMVAGTRVNGADCSDADQLTLAEMEGRRQARAIRDIVHDNFNAGQNVSLVGLSSYIGVRETRHATCLDRLTEMEVLEGVRFPDAVANGSYRVDVHHSNKPGLTFRYLDGTEVYTVPGEKPVRGRWREPREKDPTFYQIPYRSLVPRGSKNVLVTGRLLDADRGAFGAVRVMVNGNQTGEAVGTACCLALKSGLSVADVDATRLRQTLAEGGSVVI